MMLRRHENLRVGHRCAADVMDHRGAAVADPRALDHVAELALGHAYLRAVDERHKSRVRQRGADAQPVDLFFRLDSTQTNVFGVEPDHFEMLLEHAPLRYYERPHHADALRTAAL